MIKIVTYPLRNMNMERRLLLSEQALGVCPVHITLQLTAIR